MSRMVETADSSMMSATPAGSSLPIMWLRSTLISICMPLLTSRIVVGAAASPWKPANCVADFSAVALPLLSLAASFARIMRDRVGAVEGIIKAAPARVRCVQRVTRVGQGNDELRSTDLADLLVDISSLHLLRRRLGQEIADLLQERRVGTDVERLALVGAVPIVDLGLQGVAVGQQLAVFRPEIADDGGKSGPERVGVDPGFGGRFLGDEIEQDRGDLHSVGIDTLHDGLSRGNGVWMRLFRRKAAKSAPKGSAFAVLLASKPGP